MNTVSSLQDGRVTSISAPPLAILPLITLPAQEAVAGVCCGGTVQRHRARLGANCPGKSFPALLEAFFVALVLLGLKLYISYLLHRIIDSFPQILRFFSMSENRF